jgi:hypothetical protein
MTRTLPRPPPSHSEEEVSVLYTRMRMMLPWQKTVNVKTRVLKRDVALVKSSAFEARLAVSLFNLVFEEKNTESHLN